MAGPAVLIAAAFLPCPGCGCWVEAAWVVVRDSPFRGGMELGELQKLRKVLVHSASRSYFLMKWRGSEMLVCYLVGLI